MASPSEYGLFSVWASWCALGSALATLPITMSYQYLLSESLRRGDDSSEAGRQLYAIHAAMVSGSLAMLMLGVAASAMLMFLSGDVATIAACSAFFVCANGIYLSRLEVMRLVLDERAYFLSSLLRTGSTCAIVLACWLWVSVEGWVHVVVVYSISALIGSILGERLTCKHLGGLKIIALAYRRGLWSAVSNWCEHGIFTGARVLLLVLHGGTAAGIFSYHMDILQRTFGFALSAINLSISKDVCTSIANFPRRQVVTYLWLVSSISAIGVIVSLAAYHGEVATAILGEYRDPHGVAILFLGILAITCGRMKKGIVDSILGIHWPISVMVATAAGAGAFFFMYGILHWASGGQFGVVAMSLSYAIGYAFALVTGGALVLRTMAYGTRQ